MHKQIYNKLATLLIGGGVIFFCYLIRPLVKIRFGFLYTSRIGHLAYNMDNYLSIRDSKSISVFAIDKVIANIELFKIWQETDRIYFSHRAAWFSCVFLERFFSNSSMLISWKRELNPEFSLVSNTSSNIIKKTEDIEKENKLLAELGLKSHRYICFHNRDSKYLDIVGGDGNFHDFRDFEFDDYTESINYVSGIGLHSVRIGKEIKKDYISNDNLFMSIVKEKRSDFSDIALISKSLFLVGCSTGLSVTSRLYRKPQLMVNFIPFIFGDMSSWASKSVFIPKKLYDKKRNRFLTFREMALLPYDIHYQGDFFTDISLEVVDNTLTEVSKAVEEMYLRVTGNWRDSANQQLLQDKFWGSIIDLPHSREVRDELGVIVSSTFLEKNPGLI